MKKLHFLSFCLLFFNLLNAQYNDTDFEPYGQGPYFLGDSAFPNVNTAIYAYPAGAEAYMFVVADIFDPTYQLGSITTTNSFKLSDIYFNGTCPIHYVIPGQSYRFFVKIKKNGIWGKFGYATLDQVSNTYQRSTGCKAVNIPIIINSNNNPVACGEILTSGDQIQATSSIYLSYQPAFIVPANATLSPFSYVWKITRLSDNLTTQIIRPTKTFLFRRVDNPGTTNDLNLDIGSDTGQNPAEFIRPNETYRFELGIGYPDETSYILPMTACEFTTPSAQNRLISDETIDRMYNDYQKFNVLAYPNPYSNSFKILLDSKSSNEIHITVFDHLGQKIDEKSISNDEITNYELGLAYKTGFYTVIIRQNGEVKTLKLIKK